MVIHKQWEGNITAIGGVTFRAFMVDDDGRSKDFEGLIESIPLWEMPFLRLNATFTLVEEIHDGGRSVLILTFDRDSVPLQDRPRLEAESKRLKGIADYARS